MMRLPAVSQYQALFVICLTSFGWAFSFGEGAPLLSIGIKEAGFGDIVIGLNTAVYYGGLAITAPLVPMVMRRRGPKCAAFGMALSGLAMLAMPCLPTIGWWFVLRMVTGMAGAFSLIPLETYVNRDLPHRDRARNFSLYAVSLALGWATGNWIGLEMVATALELAFAIGGIVAMVSGVVLILALPPAPIHDSDAPAAPGTLHFRDNLLAYGAAWSQGFLEGGLVAFLSLYLIGIGLSEARTGWLTSATMVGVIAFQLPVAWLADRCGRVPMLILCYAMTGVGLIALPLSGDSAGLPVWLFVVGAFSGALYPLGIAVLGDRLPRAELDRANATYLSLECFGSLVGPAVMGLARFWGGDIGMFAVGNCALMIPMAAWLLARRQRQLAPANGPELASEKKAA